MLSETGTVRCTVAYVDMVGYSDVARMLEENTNAGSVGELNRQIQGFIASALKELKSPEEKRILAFTGDGAILLFERAEDAHIFGCSLQQAARLYSEQRNVSSAKRRFRIGLATGEVNLISGDKQGDQFAGIAIANAVRLQTAAGPSEILIDSVTFRELEPSSQQQYAPSEEVRGKRGETFHARRSATVRRSTTKTVANVDMVGYSDVARMLEENVSADTVAELNRQIRDFIVSAMNQLLSPGESRILTYTGDGAILLFEQADDAHRFACNLLSAAKLFSEQRTVPSAMRRFRIGIATGEVKLLSDDHQGDQYAGIVIANAQRLQAAAEPCEVLVDAFTFAALTAPTQQRYGPLEVVRGKRDETFLTHRCAPEGKESEECKPTRLQMSSKIMRKGRRQRRG